jgi:FlaA1/EpsC-like NDP-sugar epimerase
MTISEAVSLVLRASTRSQGSEIFILDMGEPIRIVDLAENMIRLAGFVPYQDIDIHFTGLRPGEKLVEELSSRSERTSDSCEEKMRIIREEPLGWNALSIWIDKLQEFLSTGNDREVLGHLQLVVPEYAPSSRPALSRMKPLQITDQVVS